MYTMNASVETSPPHPRPAKRRCPSKRKDPQYHLFTLYEDLDARVSVLEEMFGQSPTIQVDEVDFIEAVTGRILALEHHVGARYFRPLKSKGEWDCPVEDCNRNYTRLDLYHRHIKTSEGFGHKILKRHLDQDTCLPCGHRFDSSVGLLQHERKAHGVKALSRTQMFTPFITYIKRNSQPAEASNQIKQTEDSTVHTPHTDSPKPGFDGGGQGESISPSAEMGPLTSKAEDSTQIPIPTSFTGEDFEFTMAPSTALRTIEPEAREGERVFEFSMAPSAAKEGFGFTMDPWTNFSVEPEAGKDFRLGSPSAAAVRFSENGAKGDFGHMAPYVEFPAGELRGHGKEIFEFRMEPCADNVPFEDLMFGAGQGYSLRTLGKEIR